MGAVASTRAGTSGSRARTPARVSREPAAEARVRAPGARVTWACRIEGNGKHDHKGKGLYEYKLLPPEKKGQGVLL